MSAITENMSTYAESYKQQFGWQPRQPHPGTRRFLLWLLPSGPGLVNKILMREDQRGHHRKASLTKLSLIAMLTRLIADLLINDVKVRPHTY